MDRLDLLPFKFNVGSPMCAGADGRFSAAPRGYESFSEEEDTAQSADQRSSVGYCISNDLI